jgi:hypothetical protein
MKRVKKLVKNSLKTLDKKYLQGAKISVLESAPIKAELPFLNKKLNVKETDLVTSNEKLSDLKWPFFRSSAHEQMLQKYMASFKNIYADSINASNACFVLGPTKSGKSWFLRYNMRKFESSGIKPLVFHFDLKKTQMLSFSSFLH